MATTVALAAALFAAVVPTAEAATTRALAITGASAHPAVPFKAFDSNSPKVFDFNGDRRLEIIAQNDNQWVYVFDSKTGAILAEVTTKLPSGWGARSFNGPEAAILESGTAPRLIVANSAATITSYRFDKGSSTRAHFVLVKEWERRLTTCYGNPGMDSKPVFADLDRDGRMEILAATEESGIYALRDDGAEYWHRCMPGGNAEPSVADLNLDGYPDVVFGSDRGVVTALKGKCASTAPCQPAWMWEYRIRDHFNLGTASIPVGAGIGQLDGVGGPDVVVGARDSHDATTWSNDHALLLALDSGGRQLWAKQDLAGGAPLTYTHPVIVDADKNGVREVYWADWNTIGHKPPTNEADSWKRTGPAHFYRYSNTGQLVWKQTLSTFWNNKDVPLADVDGDSVQEMLANGPDSSGHDGIWYLDSRTGAKEAFVDVHPWKVMRAPVVANLYGVGTMQWVVQVASNSASAGGPAILVYDTGKPYSSAWPHLPYPTAGMASPSPSPSPTSSSSSTTSFQATFTPSKNVNDWWVEVSVTANQPVAGVKASVNGGAWTALAKTDWGTWAKSMNAPHGSSVRFQASNASGATATSGTYTWP